MICTLKVVIVMDLFLLTDLKNNSALTIDVDKTKSKSTFLYYFTICKECCTTSLNQNGLYTIFP